MNDVTADLSTIPGVLIDYTDAEFDFLFDSDNEVARRFVKLLCKRILPSIRKDGRYTPDAEALDVLWASDQLIQQRRAMAAL